MSAIKAIDATLVCIPSKTPYQMGAMERGASQAITLIARVETEDGVEGWGECCVTPGWYGPDTPASIIWLIEAVFAPRLKGVSIFDIVTRPRWRSQLLCNHGVPLDGRPIWPEPPHSGGQIGRNDCLRGGWLVT